MTVSTPPFYLATQENITTGVATKQLTASPICVNRISNITTDGSGLARTVNLPNPPLDANGVNIPAYGSRHTIYLKTITNPADTVIVTVAGSGSVTGNDPNTGFQSPLFGTLILDNSFAGQFVTFVWIGYKWTLDIQSASNGISTINAYGPFFALTTPANTPAPSIQVSGSMFFNATGAGAKTVTLPAASAASPLLKYYGYADSAAGTLKFLATGGNKIRDGATLGAANGNTISSTAGASICLAALLTGQWCVLYKSGTWTTT